MKPMAMMKTWIPVLLVTVGVALFMATVSWIEHSNGKSSQALAALADHGPAGLSNDNLVDRLSTVQLPLRLAKVDLEQGILSVDLKVTDSTISPALAYRSIAEMMEFSFAETSDVEQLLLRIVAEDRWLGTRYLLLAVDIHRGEWPSSLVEQLKGAGNEELPPEVKNLLRMTETQLWKSNLPDS